MPTPTIKFSSGGSNPCCCATILAPIMGAIADSKTVICRRGSVVWQLASAAQRHSKQEAEQQQEQVVHGVSAFSGCATLHPLGSPDLPMAALVLLP